MKILKIDFENIHSLKGYHKIDFTERPLSETGIFAIVGPTGSGKSTLLDVIMLALYGQMPRFDKKITTETVEKFGTVLTRGTKNAFVQVEYSTKGKIYRSKWYIEFKRKNYTYSMELAELPSGKIIEEKKKEIPRRNEEIIGLSYEQFLKSIVLAQGNFAKFLKADPEERTEMLEKITGTEIYRTIGRQAFETARKYKKELAEKESLLSHFQILSIEDRRIIEDEKAEIEKNSIKNTDEIKNLNEKINTKKEIKSVKEKIIIIEKNIKNNSADFEKTKLNKEKLEIHEKVYAFKTDLFELNSLDEKKNELEEKNKQRITDFDLKTELLQESKAEYEITTTNLSDATTKLSTCNPYIKEATEIKKEQEKIEQELEHKKTEHKKNEFELKNKLESLKIKTENLKQTSTTYNEINLWLKNNQLLENLNTDYILIEQLFNNYNSAKNKTTHAIDNCSFAIDFKNIGISNYLNIINQKLKNLQTKITKYNNEIININIDEYKKQYDKKIEDLQLIEKLIEISKTYTEKHTKIDFLNTEINSKKQQLETSELILTKTKNEHEIIIKKIEELEKRHEREQLEAKYEDDRLKLKEEKPCPLCGSTSHPYITEKNNTNVDFTKEKITEEKNNKKNIEKQIQDLLSEISSYKTHIENIKKQQIELTTTQQSNAENFNRISENLIEQFNINDTNNIIKHNINLSNIKNKLQEKIKSAETYQKLKNQLKEAEIIKEKIDGIFENNTKTKEKLTPYEQYYKGIKNPVDILNNLKIYHNKFKQNSKKITEISSEINTLKALISEEEKQISELSKNISSSKNKVDEIRSQLQIIKDDYATILKTNLDNLEPNVFEKSYLDKINNLKNQNFEIKNKITELSTKISDNKKSGLEIIDEIEKTSILYIKKQEILAQKLSQIGINSINEASQYLLSEKKASSIKKQLNELNETRISLNQSLEDGKLRLEKLTEKDDNTTLEQIEIQLTNTNNLQTELNRKFGSLKNQLENDDTQQKKKAEISSNFDQLTKETERWEKLSNLIGDAKGKKFAEIAQQFTLTELILLANQHLTRFSDRYILDKTGDTSNNLFVFDSFLGMTKRSVHTLSGGETFLVSMSLALALSDLASRKTKIESLFIDEGFGTLDQATLDKALVNLERLHSDYDRTIGIISHVPEIKERINTQIKITKNSDGFSSISVEN